MLRAQNLSVSVKHQHLLSDVSLHVQAGEVLAVIGPNGAGKSTLLKALCGEFPAAAGEVKINGEDWQDWTPLERARMCAVLPQTSSLSFPFVVYDVVQMGRSPHQNTQAARADSSIVKQAMKCLDIMHLRNRDYTTLSGGERQKVHFARVLAQIWQPVEEGSRILMLDEPTSALDIAFQHHCLKTLVDFARQQGIAVMAVLHDLNAAALYADRIAIMHSGRLVASGSPAEVMTKKNINDFFLFSAQVTTHPQYPECPLVIPTRSDKKFEHLH